VLTFGATTAEPDAYLIGGLETWKTEGVEVNVGPTVDEEEDEVINIVELAADKLVEVSEAVDETGDDDVLEVEVPAEEVVTGPTTFAELEAREELDVEATGDELDSGVTEFWVEVVADVKLDRRIAPYRLISAIPEKPTVCFK
jgi:hypothetical protein